jgi:GntR family transcriptional repressor for pyruvate dehydrogenase complex
MYNIRLIEKSPAVSEKVTGQIQDLISSTELSPGDELPTQAKLSERMGVSRASVREALKMLLAKGFIRQKQSGRYEVAGVTSQRITDPLGMMVERDPEHIWEVLEIAKVLVAEAARLAAERATEQEIAALGDLVAKLEIAKSDKHYFRKEFNQIYLQFYRVLGFATRNTVFFHLMHSFNEVLERAFPYPRRQLANVPGISTMLYEQHLDIWKAISGKEPSKAAESVKGHFDYIEEKLRQIVEQSETMK